MGPLAFAQNSQSAQFETRDAARMLVGSADVNGDGSISAEERDGFLNAHANTDAETPGLNRDQLLAQCLMGFYDTDQDRVFSGADLSALLARWDTDQSGDLSVAERTSGPRAFRLLDGIVLNALDVNSDQELSAEEWSASKSLDLAGWIGTTAAIQEDINGFGPGTMILTLRASLDANRDSRFDRGDVLQHFTDLDANGDGTVDAAELAPVQRRGTGPRQLTEEELSRKPGMPWQRSLEDALRLSKQTGKPLLICVNTDGESASDRLARFQYADPEFIRLAKGFIPLLASPDSHTEGDLGRQGQRLACPRFGRLVCKEHRDGEPELYRLYFSGNRVAPRHVGVSPEGEILFDLSLLQDLSIISRTLEKFGKFDVELPNPEQASLEELLASHDAAFRDELRRRFEQFTVEARTHALNSAVSDSRSAQHPELLAMGLYDPLESVRKLAAEQVIHSMTIDSVDLAPRVRWIAANDEALRQKLVLRLWGLADAEPEEAKKVRPRRLSRIYTALESPSPTLKPREWQLSLAGAPTLVANSSASDGPALELALEQVSALLGENPDDPDLNGILAQTALRMAFRAISGEGGGSPQYLLKDAEVAAQRVINVRPGDVLALSVLARAQWWSSNPSEAANNAALALPGFAPMAAAPEAAELLDILAKGREQELQAAFGLEAGWPESWLADAIAARQIQVAHPSCSAEQVIAGIQLLGNIEDYRAQGDLILQGIRRFPTSSDLHSWLRWQVLRDGSDNGSPATALESVYEELPTPEGSEPTWLWYKGLGLLIAGDTYVEEGNPTEAAAAYAASILSFEQSISWNANFTDSANEQMNKARAALEKL